MGRDVDAGDIAAVEWALSRRLTAVKLAKTAINPIIFGLISEYGCAKLARILIPRFERPNRYECGRRLRRVAEKTRIPPVKTGSSEEAPGLHPVILCVLRSGVMHRRADQGWLEVISGPMFSGKSEELIRRVIRYHLARVPTQTFKPELDTRYADKKVVSHSNLSVEAEPVSDSAQLLSAIEDRTIVVGIDEGQFFDLGLVEVATMLANAGKRVIVAGLDLDYLGRPFEPIPSLMLRAEYVTKSLAVCHRCGGPGLFTQRVVDSDELVVLGATDSYEARCRHCYDPQEAQQTRLQLVPD